MSTTKPRIGITLGDCAGIGPEIVETALKSGRVPKSAEYKTIGNILTARPDIPRRKLRAPLRLRSKKPSHSADAASSMQS